MFRRKPKEWRVTIGAVEVSQHRSFVGALDFVRAHAFSGSEYTIEHLEAPHTWLAVVTGLGRH